VRRIKSAPNTESIAARVMRVIGARVKIANVKAGNAIWRKAARAVMPSPARMLSTMYEPVRPGGGE
jgi:hypothetical protein